MIMAEFDHFNTGREQHESKDSMISEEFEQA